MKLAILSREPKSYSTQRLVAAAFARGHEAVVVDHLQCNLVLEKGRPGILYHGQPLEHFDAIGRYRREEHDRPIDASGLYQTKTEGTATFAGPRDLAMFLVTSEESHSALVRSLFHHVVKQPVGSYTPKTLTDLRTSLVKNDFNIRKLMVEIALAAVGPV